MTSLDRTGAALSAVCLVHCAALPLIAIVLPPVFGALVDHSSAVHWLLLGVAVPVSALALWRGARHHRHWGALGLGCFGLALMLLGVTHLFGVQAEVGFTLVGAAAVACGHLLNVRLLRGRHAIR